MGAKRSGGPINLHFADKSRFARYIPNSGGFIPTRTGFITFQETTDTA